MSFDTEGLATDAAVKEPIPQGLRERKKRQTRMALARAALRLFEERGYDATTIDDIAAAANVSRRTFFRYFKSKDEVFIVDPEGKLAAMHIALAEGPPDEPTLDALRRGAMAMTEAYWDPEYSRTVIALMDKEPSMMAAAMAYQVRWADALAHELAVDMGVDEHLDPRPRILEHTAIAMMRSAVAAWLMDASAGTPIDLAGEAFERGRPALEAILAMPVE